MSGTDSEVSGLGAIEAGAVCSAEPGCITCGDVAVVLTVATVTGNDALCRDEQGRSELVAIELVGQVTPGERVLVHAGVAIELVARDGNHERRSPAVGRQPMKRSGDSP
jgi:hydrogenase maturation factor